MPTSLGPGLGKWRREGVEPATRDPKSQPISTVIYILIDRSIYLSIQSVSIRKINVMRLTGPKINNHMDHMHFTTISLQLSISGVASPLKRVSFEWRLMSGSRARSFYHGAIIPMSICTLVESITVIYGWNFQSFLRKDPSLTLWL